MEMKAVACLVFAMALTGSTYSQSQFNDLSPREKKVQVLGSLWQIPINWSPIEKASHHADVAALYLPDSMANADTSILRKTMQAFVGVYYYFFLSKERVDFDSLYAGLYSIRDTTKLLYWAKCYLPEYKLHSNENTESLAAELMLFSPYKSNLFTAGNELVLFYKISSSWNAELQRQSSAYSALVAHIIGKYFLIDESKIKRISFHWDDVNGKILTYTFFPTARPFVKMNEMFF